MINITNRSVHWIQRIYGGQIYEIREIEEMGSN